MLIPLQTKCLCVCVIESDANVVLMFRLMCVRCRLGDLPDNMRLIFTAKKQMIAGHERTYNMPQTGSCVANAEVGAIVDNIGIATCNGYKRDIVVQHVGGPTFSLPSNHRMVDPLTYPILFPCGDDGWGLGSFPLTR